MPKNTAKAIELSSSLEPAYYGNRRLGPEIELEDSVVRNLAKLFPVPRWPTCVLASKRIGAGAPDLTIVTCAPYAGALADLDPQSTSIIAFLRAVRWATLETLTERLRIRSHSLGIRLDALIESELLTASSRAFSLAARWRNVLPEVVTVEAKVSNWRRATAQAARNRVFCHRSLVALPEAQAHLAASDQALRWHGIGIISIDRNGDTKMLRRSRRGRPKVWQYYYELAVESARLLRL